MRTAALLVAYAVALAAGSYLTFRPTFDSRFASAQTERGDGLLNHYILENSWLALAAPTYRGTLLTAPFYFPTKWTVYYSENLFGVAPLYWGLRLGLPHDLAYSWWQILLNALNFVAFALVGRRLKWPHPIVLGGAFMWAFAMVHADQIKHQQLICRCWMPVAAYYAIRLAEGPAARALNRLCAAVFLQSLACVYTGWFLVGGLAVFFPLLVVYRPGAWGELVRFVRANRGAVFRIVAVWTVAMLLLFVPYTLVNWGIARTFQETYHLTPTPSAWFTGPPDSKWIVTTSPYRVPIGLECWLFSGFTFYLLALAALVGAFVLRGGPRAVVAAGLLTALLWVVLALTPHDKGESFWRVVRLVPGGMAIRCVSRVYLVVYLFGLFAALSWFAHVTESVRRVWLRHAVRAVVMGLMIFEQTEYQQPSFVRADVYPRIDEVAARLKGADAGYVVPLYVDRAGDRGEGPYGEVFAMWVGLRANVPVVNGYTGRAPTGFPPGVLSDEQIRGWLKGRFRGTVRVIDPEQPELKREVVVE